MDMALLPRVRASTNTKAFSAMITRIELKNFMSHQHTVIEPAAGLTVLVGPNNIGKSAVVAALQILCRNERSNYVMRHGERECSVAVTTDDGHSIEWRRKNSPSYVIDATLFDRLGRGGVPNELQPALRLPTVDDSNGDDFDVHFGTQKAPIFLLGSSEANAARFFASSSDVIQLVSIQKRHKEKLAAAQQRKNHLEDESRRVNHDLGLLTSALEQLSEQLFQQLLGVVQEKLTVALQEILEQPIKFRADADFKRGSATVEFWIDRGGKREDVLYGQGGSVANILSVGLRIFALTAFSETKHRRFLVLDEQDCWLKPEIVPRLVKIVHEAGRALGLQVIMISHHDVALFDRFADKIYEFKPGADGAVIVVERQTSPNDADSED
jgi:DNA repair ATPase RecN